MFNIRVVFYVFMIENIKERPLHKPSPDQRKSTALGGAWNFAKLCICYGNASMQVLEYIDRLLCINEYSFQEYLDELIS